MDFITSYLNLPITDPTWVFFVVLCIILLAPMIFTKLHIPHLIGMILAGVLIGEHGFNLLERDSSFELFGKVGIYYIMFLAGLEMDLQGLKQNRTKGLVFGVLTSAIPFAFGFAAGFWLLNYSVPASLLLASIFASHTLVAYPIIGRYGVNRHRSVTVSVAATMFALLFALLILAGISGTYKGNNDVWFWVFFSVKCLLYLVGIFALYPMVIRAFFRKYSDSVMQYIFVIAMVFFAAAMAEVCGLEGILGAFLSGLVFNRFIPHTSPLMNRVEFVGNALFIPYFLIGVGMLVNMGPLFGYSEALLVVIIMVVAGTLSKYIAALTARKIFRFTHTDGLMMFGLTEAHAAGALAMVMVGTKLEVTKGVPLMNNAVLDGVVMMILISCIISSIATDQAARKMKLEEETSAGNVGEEDKKTSDDELIMVPINEPQNIEALVNTAIMMRNHKLNRGLICLNVVNDADQSGLAQEHSRKCLAAAERIAAAVDVGVQSQSRLAVNFVNGVIHAMRENNASEIIIGLHRRRTLVDSFYGRFAEGLVEGTARQIIIVNYLIPVNTIHRIIVAVPERAEYESGFYRWVERLARMAGEIGCRISFHGTELTLNLIRHYLRRHYQSVRAEYSLLDSWDDLLLLSKDVSFDHLFVVVTARPGTISYQKSFAQLPKQILSYFSNNSLMIVFPDQNGEASDNLTFSEPHRMQLASENSRISAWLSKWISNMG
ncbi:MAG: cation:proton antiporter [Bacteroides sp.]|nr:cation:proton antiporter [Roseburia sp.]MCM1347179.1 cation:proton antiporter [Bacteroides sp.]MCM1421673.1 cation:proton antiporter [Bacteroides sp.]